MPRRARQLSSGHAVAGASLPRDSGRRSRSVSATDRRIGGGLIANTLAIEGLRSLLDHGGLERYGGGKAGAAGVDGPAIDLGVVLARVRP